MSRPDYMRRTAWAALALSAAGFTVAAAGFERAAAYLALGAFTALAASVTYLFPVRVTEGCSEGAEAGGDTAGAAAEADGADKRAENMHEHE